MSKEDFETWMTKGEMKDFAENLVNTEEAVSHETIQGPFIAIGDQYIGSTSELRNLVKSRIRVFEEQIEYKSKSQQRRLIYAMLSILIIIMLCFLVLYVASESGKWFGPESFRSKLIRFYEQHNPEKILDNPDHIDYLLKRYRGKEYKLMNVLRTRYGVSSEL